MKKLLLFSILTSSLFSFDLFTENNKQVEKSDITNLLHREVKLIELDKTKFKIVNEDKYNSTGSNISDVFGSISISNNDNTLSSMSFKLKRNIWYFVRLNEENVFKFFEYTASDKKIYSENNFYIKLLDDKTNVLFKTKNKFEPISIERDEILKFILMNDDLKPNEFILERNLKGDYNVKP